MQVCVCVLGMGSNCDGLKPLGLRLKEARSVSLQMQVYRKVCQVRKGCRGMVAVPASVFVCHIQYVCASVSLSGESAQARARHALSSLVLLCACWARVQPFSSNSTPRKLLRKVAQHSRDKSKNCTHLKERSARWPELFRDKVGEGEQSPLCLRSKKVENGLGMRALRGHYDGCRTIQET